MKYMAPLRAKSVRSTFDEGRDLDAHESRRGCRRRSDPSHEVAAERRQAEEEAGESKRSRIAKSFRKVALRLLSSWLEIETLELFRCELDRDLTTERGAAFGVEKVQAVARLEVGRVVGGDGLLG